MDRPATNSIADLLPLLRDALAEQQRFRMPLRGTSMLPTLPSECEIEVVPLTQQPHLGALIVFASGDSLIVHRLVRRSTGLWITHGDGRLGADTPIVPAQVLGEVAAANAPGGRRCWPRRSSTLEGFLWIGRHHLLRPFRWIWHRCAPYLRRLISRRPIGSAS